MENGCCLCCLNCCSFNCFNSFYLSIYQIISTIIGIIANSWMISLTKKILDVSKFLSTTYAINISFFSSGTTISTIILILKKLEKLNQSGFYLFGWLGSKIYSICSKILMIVNIFGFFYLISFTQFITMNLDVKEGQNLFNNTKFEHVGPGKEIEYHLKYRNGSFYCDNRNCSSDEIYYDEDGENFFSGNIFSTLVFSLISCFIMFLNGESFSSDSTRIKFLSTGKLSIEFKPIEIANSICKRENSCKSLNCLFCYNATVFKIEVLLSFFSFFLIVFWVILVILYEKYLPIQIHFITFWILIPPMVVSLGCFLLGLCCASCCCRNRDPCWKKFCAIIVLFIAIIAFLDEIISLSLALGTLNGKIKFTVDCSDKILHELDHQELYESLCFEDYKNKYLLITLKSCSLKDIAIVFAIISLNIFLTFYIIVLLLNYIRRGAREHPFPKRAYETIMFLIENGQKICVDDIKIEKEQVKFTENKGGKVIEYAKNIYKRIILQNQTTIYENRPIIYNNN